MAFPSKDADFNDYLVIAVPYLNTHAARLQISTANIAQLNTLYSGANGWTAIYTKSQDPNTATSTITADKTTLRGDMEDLLRDIYDDIAESALTEADRQTLKLPERDTTPTHAPVADHAPTVTIDGYTHLQITLRITDPDNPGTQAMPKKQHAEVNVAVGTPIVWDPDRTFNTGRFLKKVSFAEGDVGKQASFLSLIHI